MIRGSRIYENHCRKWLLDLLRENTPSLKPIDIRSRNGYRSENDALRMLHMIEKTYEPFFSSLIIDHT